MTTIATPRIYVACLAAYNAGNLHGEWIDADQDVEAINAEIQAMLKASPEPGEEWAIHDYEGFGKIKLSETESIEDVAALAQAIEEHENAFMLFYAQFGCDYNDVEGAVDSFQERFQGKWDSLADYVEDFWEQCGDMPKASGNTWWHPANYIDWDRMANDLEKGGDVTSIEHEGDVYVFNNNY